MSALVATRLRRAFSEPLTKGSPGPGTSILCARVKRFEPHMEANRVGDALFLPYCACRFVVPKRNELRVPEVIVARPLQVLDVGHQHRLEPPTVLHFFRSQPRPPPAALPFREIHERTT